MCHQKMKGMVERAQRGMEIGESSRGYHYYVHACTEVDYGEHIDVRQTREAATCTDREGGDIDQARQGGRDDGNRTVDGAS